MATHKHLQVSNMQTCCKMETHKHYERWKCTSNHDRIRLHSFRPAFCTTVRLQVKQTIHQFEPYHGNVTLHRNLPLNNYSIQNSPCKRIVKKKSSQSSIFTCWIECGVTQKDVMLWSNREKITLKWVKRSRSHKADP